LFARLNYAELFIEQGDYKKVAGAPFREAVVFNKI